MFARLLPNLERMVLVAPFFDYTGFPFSMRAMGRIASVLYWMGLGRMYAAWGARPRRSPPFATNKLTTDIGRYRRNMELYEKFPKLALGGPTVAWVRAAWASRAAPTAGSTCAAASKTTAPSP